MKTYTIKSNFTIAGGSKTTALTAKKSNSKSTKKTPGKRRVKTINASKY